MPTQGIGGQRSTIVWLTYGLPWPTNCGAAIRYFHLLRQVAARHRVILLAVLESAPRPEDVAALAPLCEEVVWAVMRSRGGLRRWQDLCGHIAAGRPLATWPYCPRELEARLREMLSSGGVDILQIEHSFLAPFRKAVSDGACRTVLAFHNFGESQYRSMLRMEARAVERLLWLGRSLLMRGWEARHAARFDRCLSVSPVEAARLAIAIGRPVDLVPNGVDTATLQPLPAPASGNHLLFVGHLRYPPNVDAVRFLIRRILPAVRRRVPDATLTVVGDGPSSLLAECQGPGVTAAGQVPDLIPHYLKAQVALAPLRAGGGTRLKILEAMALGRPVVSTTLGCEGLAVTPGDHLLVADGAVDLAAAILRLLQDGVLRERLATNARRLVEREYDWAKIGARLLAVYDDLLQDLSAPPASSRAAR